MDVFGRIHFIKCIGYRRLGEYVYLFQINEIACSARGMASYITTNRNNHSQLYLYETKVPTEIDPEKGR